MNWIDSWSLFLFSWPRFNSDSFTQNCRLNSKSTVSPSIAYKLFQTQFISAIFQIQLISNSLLKCIDSVHLDSILVNWIDIDWWIRIVVWYLVSLPSTLLSVRHIKLGWCMTQLLALINDSSHYLEGWIKATEFLNRVRKPCALKV